MGKVCNRCGEPRELADFDRDARNPDGRTGTCKVCRREAVRAKTADPDGREDRLAKQRNRSRRYAAGNREAVLAAKRRYNATEASRDGKRAYNRKYRKAQPEKVRARLAVAYAVRVGKMPAARDRRCHVCGEPAAHYHHHNGYAPEHKLDVVPVCVTHHVD